MKTEKLIELLKQDFSGSSDYLSGVNDGMYHLFNRIKGTNRIEAGKILKFIDFARSNKLRYVGNDCWEQESLYKPDLCTKEVYEKFKIKLNEPERIKEAGEN